MSIQTRPEPGQAPSPWNGRRRKLLLCLLGACALTAAVVLQKAWDLYHADPLALAERTSGFSKLPFWWLAQRAPRYAGKTLDEWLERYGPNFGTEGPPAADKAFLAMGERAVPAVLLAGTDPPQWKVEVNGWLYKCGLQVRLKCTDAEVRRRQIRRAFHALRNEPGTYWALASMYVTASGPHAQWFQCSAVSAMGWLGERNEARLIPFLLVASRNTNDDVRRSSFLALKGRTAKPDATIPLLTRALEDPNLYVRATAASDLEEFGPRAVLALPALARLQEKATCALVSDSVSHAISAISRPPAEAGVNTRVGGLAGDPKGKSAQ